MVMDNMTRTPAGEIKSSGFILPELCEIKFEMMTNSVNPVPMIGIVCQICFSVMSISIVCSPRVS